jgi:hypothetical protein
MFQIKTEYQHRYPRRNLIVTAGPPRVTVWYRVVQQFPHHESVIATTKDRAEADVILAQTLERFGGMSLDQYWDMLAEND